MTATITVDPATLTAPGSVDLHLSGFTKNQKVSITVDGKTLVSGVRVGSKGTLDYVGVVVGATSSLGAHPVLVKKAGTTTVLASASFTVVTAPVATVPGVPTGLLALAGDTVVGLSWAAPASDGGSPITGYVIRYGAIKTSGASSPYTVENLTNGQAYSFTVAAVNAVGEGPQTAPVSATPVKVITPPPGTPAFLARPASGALHYNGGASVLIENVAIRLGSLNSPSGIAIYVENVNGTITIRDVDWSDVIGGIFIRACSGVLIIERVRGRNVGDGTIGAGHSNHIQLNETVVSGHIAQSKFLGGRTEDMLSTWHSGGKGVGQELVIEDNQLQGLVADTATARAWTGGSGTGIILSDTAAPGGYAKSGNLIVRRNTLLTPGQVGIQMIDGPNLTVEDNTILLEQRAGINNSMTTWAGKPQGIATRNRYYVTKADGSHPDPWLYAQTGMTFTANPEDPNLKASDLAVVL